MLRLTGNVFKLMSLILFIGISAALYAGGGSQAAQSSGATTASGYPIVTDGSVTLRYWIPINITASNYIRSYSENISFQEFMKKTGINLDFIHPASGQETESFNLMIASRDLPDLIEGPQRYRGGTGAGLADGAYLDLTTYLERWAPDYYALVKSDIRIWREVTTPDNRFAAFHQIKPDRDPLNTTMMVNYGILEELGFGLPTTIADYTAIFEAYRSRTGQAGFAPNQNGRDPLMMGAFDIFNNFYPDHGTVKFGPYEAMYRDYLELYAEWFRRGFIFEGFPATTIAQRRTLLYRGEILALQADVDNTMIMGLAAGARPMPAPFPRQRPGQMLHTNDWEAVPTRPSGTIAVSGNTRYREEAIRFLNYGYTPEGSLIHNFGVEGVTFTMVNGRPQLTDYALNHPTLTPEGVNYVLNMFVGPMLAVPGRYRNPNIHLHPENYQLRMNIDNDPNLDSAFAMPTLVLPSEDATRNGRIMADVNTYLNEMTLRFITGAESLSRFPEYQAQLRSFGIEEAIAIQQRAYNMYVGKQIP